MSRITSPFGYRATALEVASKHDLHGRVAIVTGGASGIGIETARALAKSRAEVILAVRDVERAAPVVEELRQSTDNKKISAAELNLASLASIRRFAESFLQQKKPLQILINNAGVMACPLSHTEDGFETQFGTNHLGHFLLTVLLKPALLAGAPARVVSVSSVGHRRSDINFDDPNYKARPYDKWEAYGQSKTANILFSIALTQHWRAQNIYSNALMPGGIMTGLQKFLPKEEMVAMGWFGPDGKLRDIFKTPEQGAATSVWAALGAELEGVGGLYLEDCQEALPFDPKQPYAGYNPYARSVENAERLWKLSAELVGVKV